MIRKRRGKKAASALPESSEGQREDEKNHCQTARQQRDSSRGRQVHPLWYSLHFASVLFVIAGVFLSFNKLYTHRECDMTWSRRQFLEIVHDSGQSTSKYRLFKFMDQRDPRHQRFLHQSRVDAGANDWCMLNTPAAVLYVPGHGGSYEQSRSLGAHGLQLTGRYSNNAYERRILHKLGHMQTMNSGANSTIVDFFYDVYAIDFREEGGGFHGALLERQAAFIADAVQELSIVCNYNSLVVVAHSIGGISTRLALQEYPSKMSSIRHVITLGTPHARPVLTWEPGMLNIYQRLLKPSTSNASDTTLISISGGLRDEMIPPASCWVGQNKRTLSLMATDIMIPGTIEAKDSPPLLGMDHRAIVWCHNLLSPIRTIIHALVRDDSGSIENVREALQPLVQLDGDYHDAVERFWDSMKREYGYLTALAMETSLLYNADLLVDLYAFIGVLHYLNLIFAQSRPTLSLLLPAFVVSAVLYLFQLQYTSFSVAKIPFLSVLLLAFVADAAFLFVQAVLNRFVRGRWKRRVQQNTIRLYVFCGLVGLALFCTAANVGSITWRQPLIVLFSAALIIPYSLSLILVARLPCTTKPEPVFEKQATWCDRQVCFVTLVMVLLPFIYIGELVALLEGIFPWTILKLCLALGIRLDTSLQVPIFSSPNYTASVFQVFRALVVGFFCRRVLALDLENGEQKAYVFHPLATVLLSTVYVDMVEAIFFESGSTHKQ